MIRVRGVGTAACSDYPPCSVIDTSRALSGSWSLLGTRGDRIEIGYLLRRKLQSLACSDKVAHIIFLLCRQAPQNPRKPDCFGHEGNIMKRIGSLRVSRYATRSLIQFRPCALWLCIAAAGLGGEPGAARSKKPG